MFERYTEHARRVVFFAVYEAKHYKSPFIESEHFLLGLLRENYGRLKHLLPPDSAQSIRTEIDNASREPRPKAMGGIELPLSNECKRVLAYGAEEAERLADKHIGTEHLLLGLLRENKCFAAQILMRRGLVLEKLREQLASGSAGIADTFTRRHSKPAVAYIELHGQSRHADPIRERTWVVRKSKWFWHKSSYKPRDVIVRRETGELSFDLELSESQNFELLRGGWKKDLCLICDWEIFESKDEPEHGIAYSNGRDWICTECYEKFLHGPDYFATSYPEIT